MWWSSCCTQTSIITKAPWKCTEKQSDLHCFFFGTFNWEIENLWAKGRCSHPGFNVDWICRLPRISPLEMGTASQLCGETPSPTRMKWKLVTAEALNTLLYLTALIAFSPWKKKNITPFFYWALGEPVPMLLTLKESWASNRLIPGFLNQQF